jgi:3-dehydro-L-gulonate 2-dehydrogenase
MRIQYGEMKSTLSTILQSKGVEESSANHIATVITESSTDGVYSHGLNRFTSIIENIEAGIIDVHASPEVVSSFGALEVIEGNLGMGKA